MKRYSKKRQGIVDCLKKTDEHPNAEWVYNKLKPLYPDLSLGTVYRNINELKKSGEICSLGVVLDKERFDGRTEPHSHAVCVKCGKIIDVDNFLLPDDTIEEIQKLTDFKIAYSQLQFIGLCEKCKKNCD